MKLLKEARISKGLSQQELEECTEIVQRNLSDIEIRKRVLVKIIGE